MSNTPYTILVIEDEPSLQKAIADKLEISGFRVITARSSKEALELITKNKGINAIWLDHYLLGRDTGLNFLHEVKKLDDYKEIKVFVVSNSISPDKTVAYFNTGVEKYYTKANHRLDQIVTDIKDSLSVIT